MSAARTPKLEAFVLSVEERYFIVDFWLDRKKSKRDRDILINCLDSAHVCEFDECLSDSCKDDTVA